MYLIDSRLVVSWDLNEITEDYRTIIRLIVFMASRTSNSGLLMLINIYNSLIVNLNGKSVISHNPIITFVKFFISLFHRLMSP